MAGKKETLGKDLDKMEDFDFDFDTDFGGDFFAEEAPPATKREAVAKTMKSAGKSFAGEFDIRDPEKITEFISSAIPDSLSTEYKSLIDLKGSILEELTKSGPEIKRNTNKLLKTINRYLPKNKISAGIGKLIEKTESTTTTNFSNQKSKESMIEESIAAMIDATMAKDDRSSAENRIQQEIQFRKDLNQLEISNHIVANLDRLINFENTVTSNYYKKSLDLQYRLLSMAGQNFELNKLYADTNRNQLEAVIRNTSLPDVVKVRSTEVIKMLALQNASSGAMKSLFGEGSRLGRVKDRLAGVAKNKIGNLAFGLQSANMGADMADGVKDQAGMMGGASGMAGDMLGSEVGKQVRNMFGEITGRFLEKNEKSANKVADIKEFFSDPRSWFKEKLDESYANNKDPSLLERKKRDFLTTMADATNNTLKDGYISIGKVNLDDSAIYTKRTDNSINKTIPRLLSEILFNTAGTNLTLQQHTGITPDVDKMRIDPATGKLISDKTSMSKIKSRFEDAAKSGGGAYNVRRATSTFLEDGKMNLSEKERAEVDRAVSEYLMEGGKVTTDMFKDKKLLSKLKDKKLIKRVNRAGEDFNTRGSKLDRSKAKTDFNNHIDGALTSIKSPEQLFDQMIKEGNLDQLEEIGLIKMTKDGNPVVDNKKYKELISGAFYKESLKYAENDSYKNNWDLQSDKDKADKALASKRVDSLKAGAKNLKDKAFNKVGEFSGKVKDGSVEDKIKEVMSQKNFKKQVDAFKEKSTPIMDNAQKFTDSVLDNIRSQTSTDTASKLVKSIITIDGNGTAILEKMQSIGDKRVKSKEEVLEENLEKLSEAITKNTESTETSNKLSVEELKSTKVRFNDKNKDGVRDGSFQEKLGGAFRTGGKNGAVPPPKEAKPEKDKSGGSSGILGAVFGGLSSMLGGLFGGLSGILGGLTSMLGSIGGSVIGPLIGGLSRLIPGAIGGAASMLGRGAKKGIKGGAKGIGKFAAATKGTRGFERKMLGGLLGKVGGAALRKLPLIGLLAGGYMGFQMIKDGDTVGGLGSIVSSLFAQIPGIGTALSLGVDGLMALRGNEDKEKVDIEAELESKKNELEERNSMMQKANENNWEKEAIMLQNKFDKYTSEQDLIKNKINELEGTKFKTASKDKLLEKEKEKLSQSEKALAEAKAVQTKLDLGSKALTDMKKKRDEFLKLAKDNKFPDEIKAKFQTQADMLDGEIRAQENKNNELKKFVDSQNKADTQVGTLADPAKRLAYAEKAREVLVKQIKVATDPNAVLALSKAVAKQDSLISDIKKEMADSSVTEEAEKKLNVGNDRSTIEKEIKQNSEAYKDEDGNLKSADEVQNGLMKKMLEARISDLEQRKVNVNEAYKKKHAGKSGYGSYSGSGSTGGASSSGGGYSGGDVSLADEATIAKNSYKGGDVKAIINKASQRAGIDATLMQVMAAKESSFNPNAKAPTSSATGLYQFLNATWKEVLGQYGGKYDLNTGNASRLDPEHSSLMAAEYLKSNLKTLKSVKANPNITDAYLTHFLGAGGARKFLKADPSESSETVLGRNVVSANGGIFIGNGRVKTVKEAYDTIASQLAKTAGQFGIKVDKSDLTGSMTGKINTKPEEIPGNNAAADIQNANTSNASNTTSTPPPIRKSNEISQTAGVTAGHGSLSVPSVAPKTEATIPEQVKQSVYNNGIDKIAKDDKDRREQLARAQAELERKQNSYKTPQSQVNNTQPYNNVSDPSFKAQMANNQALADSSGASIAKLDTIAINTGRTVDILIKIHDKLDNLNANSKSTPTNNQSSNMNAINPDNAISLKRGASVKS